MHADDEFTTKQAAEHAGVDQATILAWLRGKLFTYRRNNSGHFLIDKASFEQFLTSRQASSSRQRNGNTFINKGIAIRNLVVIVKRPLFGAFMVAIVGTILGGIALFKLETFFNESGSSVQSLTIANIQTEGERVTLQDFLVDQYAIPSGTRSEEIVLIVATQTSTQPIPLESLTTLGYVATFDLDAEGFEGKQCQVRWTLEYAVSGVWRTNDYLTDQPGFPHSSVLFAVDEERASDIIWVPAPPRSGPFRLTLALYSSDRAPDELALARITSEEFR